MILTKDMIRNSFTVAMLFLYKFSIEDGSYANRNVHNSPVEVDDITSMFTKREFQELAEPHLRILEKVDDDYNMSAVAVEIAYNWVMAEYNRREAA
jgi:hypothetical protein